MATQCFAGNVSFPDMTTFPNSAATFTSATNQLNIQPGGAGFKYVHNATNPGQTTTITYYDPGTVTVSPNFGVSQVITAAAAIVLTASQSGAVIFVNQASAFQITLPVVLAGLHYRFIVNGSHAFAVTIRPVANAQCTLCGVSTDTNANPVVDGTGANSFTIVATASVGDMLDIWCDGAIYYGTAVVAVHSKITCP